MVLRLLKPPLLVFLICDSQYCLNGPGPAIIAIAPAQIIQGQEDLVYISHGNRRIQSPASLRAVACARSRQFLSAFVPSTGKSSRDCTANAAFQFVVGIPLA